MHLRWLAGGSYLDITDISGVSCASFYRIVHKTLAAIEAEPSLAIRWPKGNAEVNQIVAGFTGISDDGVIDNCGGVLDGYLARIRVPVKSVVGNVRSYFSGHYQCYGLNLQAVADHHSRFLYLAVAAPGVTADRCALQQCDLNDLIESLPMGICIIGDAAYEATEHLVPIYHGNDRKQAKYDDFCYYASQLRIRIEMAFGFVRYTI